MTETIASLPIQARHTFYLLIVVIWLMLVAVFGKFLEFGVVKHIDWTYFAMIGPLFGLCLLGLMLMALRLIWPPRLDADDRGLSLRIGLRTRRWAWAQIEGFRLVRTKESFVAFNWYPRGGARRQGKWLQYPFPSNADDLLATLDARLVAAKGAGTAAAAAPSLSADDREAEDAKVERIRKQSNHLMLTAVGTFIACIIILNLQTTKMLTPASSAVGWSLALGVGTIGLFLPFTILRLANARPSAPVPLGRNLLLGALTGPACFAMFAAFGSMMADAFSNHLAFSGRYGPTTTRNVLYPIDHILHGRGGTKAVSYPYGLVSVDLPINPVDVPKIKAAGNSQPLCYPVTEQRSGPAIRYVIPSAGIGNRSIVVPCDPRRTAPSA